MGPKGEYLNDWRTFGEYLLQKSFNTISLNGTGPQVRERDESVVVDVIVDIGDGLVDIIIIIHEFVLFQFLIDVIHTLLSYLITLIIYYSIFYILYFIFCILYLTFHTFHMFHQYRGAASVMLSVASGSLICCSTVTEKFMPLLLGKKRRNGSLNSCKMLI